MIKNLETRQLEEIKYDMLHAVPYMKFPTFIANISLSIYPVKQGDIPINGNVISQIPQEELWDKANVVLQENHFFYGTVRSNLQLARNDVTDEEIEKALLKVKLPHFKLDVAVLEKGENLSGGEKQRIAIARAMLRGERNCFLDEPTSSLDALTEKFIYEQLLNIVKKDTLVLVSHR